MRNQLDVSTVLHPLHGQQLTETTDPSLYYHGGDVRMARFFSRFIALQIQAQVLGQPLKPYTDSSAN